MQPSLTPDQFKIPVNDADQALIDAAFSEVISSINPAEEVTMEYAARLEQQPLPELALVYEREQKLTDMRPIL